MNEELVEQKKRGRPRKVESVETISTSDSEFKFRYKGARIYDITVCYSLTEQMVFVSKVSVFSGRSEYNIIKMIGNIGVRKTKKVLDKMILKRWPKRDVVYYDQLMTYLKVA